MKEHYVSLEQAKRLHELGFDGVDKYYVTESFCYGGDPNDYYAEGMLVDEYIVYFVNDNNEDDFRGVPAPRLDQAAKWLREVKGVHIMLLRRDGLYISYVYMGYGIVVSTTPADYESSISAFIDKALELLGKDATDE